MNNIHDIYDPITGNQYSIFSNEGKRVLKQYIKQFQTGGMVIKLNKDMFSSQKMQLILAMIHVLLIH